MSFSIATYNSSGGLIFDGSRRLGRILGTLQSGTANGSFTPTANYGTGTLFAVGVDISTAEQVSSGCPKIWVSGGTVYWSFNPDGASSSYTVVGPKNTLIMYGVF